MFCLYLFLSSCLTMHSLLSSIQVVPWLLVAGAHLSQAASATCDQIIAAGAISTVESLNLQYTDISDDYW